MVVAMMQITNQRFLMPPDEFVDNLKNKVTHEIHRRNNNKIFIFEKNDKPKEFREQNK